MDLTELKPYTLPVGPIPAGWLETEGRACARPSQKGHQGVCKKLADHPCISTNMDRHNPRRSGSKLANQEVHENREPLLRPPREATGRSVASPFYQKLCRIPARTATWLLVEEGVRNVNAATAAFPVESIPVARSHEVVA